MRRAAATAAWGPALALSVAAAAAAQEPAGAAGAPDLPSELTEAIDPIVEAARERALPVDPLVAKAREGSAKGIPADRIRTAVEALASRLERARTVLGAARPETAPRPAEIAAGASALGRGVPEDALGQLGARVSGDRPVALAMHTLADLVERGIPVDGALDVLEAWSVRRGEPVE
ncbi:MAG: hypothetical protein ACODAE_08190, partial [Gemmatimonadota bacterium]